MDNPLKPKQPKLGETNPFSGSKLPGSEELGKSFDKMMGSANKVIQNRQPQQPKPNPDPVREKIMKQGFAPNKNTEYVDRIKSMAIYPRIESKYGKDYLDKGMDAISKTFNSKQRFPTAFRFDAKANPDYEYDVHKDNFLGDAIYDRATSYLSSLARKEWPKLSNKQKMARRAEQTKIHNAINALLRDQELSTLFEDELNNSLRQGIENNKKARVSARKYADKVKTENTKNKLDAFLQEHPEFNENREFIEKLMSLGFMPKTIKK